MVRRLFSEPNAFFAEKVTENGFRKEIMVLFATGALGAVGMGYVMQFFLGGLAGSRDLMRINLVGKAISIFIGPFLLWVYYTGSVHAVSWFKNARSPIARLFKVSAWSLVPIALANLVYSIALFLSFRDEDIPDNPPGVRVSDKVEFLFGLANDEPTMIFAWLVMAAAVIYVGYLLSIGIQHARDLSEEDARQVVALPVAGHLVFVIYTLLTQVGVL